MLLMYCKANTCLPLLDKLKEEGYEEDIFHVICESKSKAIEELEIYIKANDKLSKDGVYYVYLYNCYEYYKYGVDSHFVFDYCIGDIKVLEGKIVSEEPFDAVDFDMVSYTENIDQEYINDYEPMPDFISDRLKDMMDKIKDESIEPIKIEKPYDWIEKKDEIDQDIASSLSGGDFTPISIKMSDEAMEKFKEHDRKFYESGFRAMVRYLRLKNGEKDE